MARYFTKDGPAYRVRVIKNDRTVFYGPYASASIAKGQATRLVSGRYQTKGIFVTVEQSAGWTLTQDWERL